MVAPELPYRFLTCVFWLNRKTELLLSLLGIIFCIPALRTLDFIFLKAFCNFFSVAASGSVVTLLKPSVFNNVTHFSVYLVISNITTPLALSCFKISFLFLDRLSMTFLYLYGTLILLYFSQLLLSSAFNDVNSLSGPCVKFIISLGKTLQILPHIPKHILKSVWHY